MKFSKALGIVAAAFFSSSAFAIGDSGFARSLQAGARILRAAAPAPPQGKVAPLSPAVLLDSPIVNLTYQLLVGQGGSSGHVKSWRVRGTVGGLQSDYAVSQTAASEMTIRGVFAGQKIDAVGRGNGMGGKYSSRGHSLPVDVSIESIGGGFKLSGTVAGTQFSEELDLDPTAALTGHIFSIAGAIGGVKFTESAQADMSNPDKNSMTISGSIGKENILIQVSQLQASQPGQDPDGGIFKGSFGQAAVDETVAPAVPSLTSLTLRLAYSNRRGPGARISGFFSELRQFIKNHEIHILPPVSPL